MDNKNKSRERLFQPLLDSVEKNSASFGKLKFINLEYPVSRKLVISNIWTVFHKTLLAPATVSLEPHMSIPVILNVKSFRNLLHACSKHRKIVPTTVHASYRTLCYIENIFARNFAITLKNSRHTLSG